MVITVVDMEMFKMSGTHMCDRGAPYQCERRVDALLAVPHSFVQ